MCPIKLSTKIYQIMGEGGKTVNFEMKEDVVGRYVKGATRISH